jgi:carbon-monoxide dehydrogenase medium subunit
MLAVENGRCTAVQIAVGGGAPVPIRSAAAEAALTGTPLGEADIAAAARTLAEAADPIDDFRGSAAYRRKLIPRIVARAVAAAKRKLA